MGYPQANQICLSSLFIYTYINFNIYNTVNSYDIKTECLCCTNKHDSTLSWYYITQNTKTNKYVSKPFPIWIHSYQIKHRNLFLAITNSQTYVGRNSLRTILIWSILINMQNSSQFIIFPIKIPKIFLLCLDTMLINKPYLIRFQFFVPNHKVIDFHLCCNPSATLSTDPYFFSTKSSCRTIHKRMASYTSISIYPQNIVWMPCECNMNPSARININHIHLMDQFGA